MSWTGLVFAGGESRRMGRDKALLEIGGKTLLQRAIDLVRGAGGTPIVVGRLRPPDQVSGARQIDESLRAGRPSCGPLMALRWGLADCGSRRVLALACDLPFITSDLIRFLLDQSDGFDACVPRSGGMLHPLAAVYDRECLPSIDRRLADGHRSVHRLIDDLNARIVEEEELARFGGPRLLHNVNKPEHLLQAKSAVEGKEE